MSAFKDREEGRDEDGNAVTPAPAGARHHRPDAQKAPAELWAERKGFLPAMARAGVPNPENWKYAAASAFVGWAPGQLVTEHEFDEAILNQGKPVSR